VTSARQPSPASFEASITKLEEMRSQSRPIRGTLLPLRDRIIFLKDGQDVVPGVQAMSTPGHTVGHTSFVISSQGNAIVNIADLGHQPALQMENPRAEFARDTDPKQGVTTRLRMFDMVASQKIPIIAYHFPWPGIGHVAKRGDRYRYVAVEMLPSIAALATHPRRGAQQLSRVRGRRSPRGRRASGGERRRIHVCRACDPCAARDRAAEPP
jgi:glyoxylase-like metal-dependent hydrolase (beta-lactamase superfamily II)